MNNPKLDWHEVRQGNTVLHIGKLYGRAFAQIRETLKGAAFQFHDSKGKSPTKKGFRNVTDADTAKTICAVLVLKYRRKKNVDLGGSRARRLDLSRREIRANHLCSDS